MLFTFGKDLGDDKNSITSNLGMPQFFINYSPLKQLLNQLLGLKLVKRKCLLVQFVKTIFN